MEIQIIKLTQVIQQYADQLRKHEYEKEKALQKETKHRLSQLGHVPGSWRIKTEKRWFRKMKSKKCKRLIRVTLIHDLRQYKKQKNKVKITPCRIIAHKYYSHQVL